MSKLYECSLFKRLVDAYIESELIISPEDYLYCETEAELSLEIQEDIQESMNTGDVSWDESENEVNIPEGFINEWRTLKYGKTLQ